MVFSIQKALSDKRKNECQQCKNEHTKSHKKIEGVTRDEHIKRISELHDFITQNPQTEFDESLVRHLLQKVTVYDDYYTVEFKSGVHMDFEG